MKIEETDEPSDGDHVWYQKGCNCSRCSYKRKVLGLDKSFKGCFPASLSHLFNFNKND